MPDSPKCYPCINQGLEGQTYRLAGQHLYKCSDCKRLYPENSFQEEDFLWKEDHASWLKYVEGKKAIIGDKGHAVLEKLTKRVKELR